MISSALRSLVYAITSPRLIVFLFRPLFFLLGLHGPGDLPLLAAQRVMVVRLDEIGDLVLLGPFLRELRRNMPSARITLIVKPALGPLFESCPYVDEVLTFDWKVRRYVGHLTRIKDALLLSKRCLWGQRFELAITPRWDADYYHSAFVAYLSGARRRVAFAENVTESKARHNRGYDRFFTDLCHDASVRHEVEQNLSLIRFMGGTVESSALELATDPAAVAAARTLLAGFAGQQHPLVALAPGAGAMRRCWPVDRFVTVACALLQTNGFRFVVVGGSADRELGETICVALGERALNLAGRCTLPQTAAVLEQCDLYLGNDSGPMHLAAAGGTAVVEISCHPKSGTPSHENSPLRFGPWGVPARILQPLTPTPPCAEGCAAYTPHCILGIGVDEVVEAAQAMFAEARLMGREQGGGRGPAGEGAAPAQQAQNVYRNWGRLLALRQMWRRQGKQVVWTNGCFDLVHAGHVRSLQAAKALGDILVVGLNSDNSVRALKGLQRPVMPEEDRAAVLAALSCIDRVIIFDELTPEQALQKLQPDIHCKGADYKPPFGKPIPELSLVESYGGRVEYLPLVEGLSTTEIIQRIRSLP